MKRTALTIATFILSFCASGVSAEHQYITFDENENMVVSGPFEAVIPKPAKNRIKMNTQELLSSIRRANLLATPDFQAIKFEVFSDKMVVSKMTPDVGESREEISVEYEGAEMVVGFNPSFLIDCLKNVEQE